ncbi:Uncharacterised protein [Amycolatopsis camponoti]|uniref:Immunity protein 53 n=1 Tax=Amycolatopsis camponoti TaxID=2606593 RepID=A0A6I8MAY9_9PSEU|nr:Imm53 family immunity protein [Amycolatopsis camponoti]VVJ24922.1 Uncharacterised protein [Amycolatopsis camponoti]
MKPSFAPYLLSDWYSSQCDGDREHEFGVRLETLDNAGWRLRIDPVGTDVESQRMPRSEEDLGPGRWLWTSADGESYEASCDVRSLEALLAAFRTVRRLSISTRGLMDFCTGARWVNLSGSNGMTTTRNGAGSRSGHR